MSDASALGTGIGFGIVAATWLVYAVRSHTKLEAKVDEIERATAKELEREASDRKESCASLGKRTGDLETDVGILRDGHIRHDGLINALDIGLREHRENHGSRPAMAAVRPPFPSRHDP